MEACSRNTSWNHGHSPTQKTIKALSLLDLPLSASMSQQISSISWTLVRNIFQTHLSSTEFHKFLPFGLSPFVYSSRICDPWFHDVTSCPRRQVAWSESLAAQFWLTLRKQSLQRGSSRFQRCVRERDFVISKEVSCSGSKATTRSSNAARNIGQEGEGKEVISQGIQILEDLWKVSIKKLSY